MNKFLKGSYIPYVIAFLGTCGLRGVTALGASEDIRYGNSIFSVFVYVVLAFLLVRVWEDFIGSERIRKVWACVFSVLLSVALHFGARLEAAENVRIDNISLWFRIIALVVYITPVITVLLGKLPALSDRLFTADTGDGNGFKLIYIWAIIFMLWIPVFLALFPGAFVYDAQEEYIEVISRNFNMHHPLIHVLILGGLVHAAEYIGWTANAGIALYVILQMLIMSLILAYLITKLKIWGLKKTYCTVVMLIFGLFPVYPMYAVCTAKDGLFTAFLLLAVVELTQYIVNPEDFNPVLFTLGSVLMMLLRNNGAYAYIVAVIPFILIELSRLKGGKKSLSSKRACKVLILMLLSILLYFGSNTVLKIATQAEDNEHQEILTVPIQQLARVYTYSSDVLTDEEIKTLHEYLPEDYLITYRFRVSDVLKSGFDNAQYERDPASFRNLWLRIGLKKPLIYLNAWFGTSYGYWYPDALNNVYEGNQMYTFQYTDSSYFGFETEPPGQRDSKFPILERFYEKLSLHRFQQNVPVISQLFSPGFMWWICALMICMIVCRGRKNLRRLLPLLPVVFVWLTVLLGPTTLVRYVLILWFVIPLYPVILNKELFGLTE